jgi:hypothetical protein
MRRGLLALAALVAALGCEKPRTYDTTMEVVHVQRFGQKATSLIELQLRYTDCPGDARRVIRLDKTVSQCLKDVQDHTKLPAQIRSTWQSDVGRYRNDIVRLGECPVTIDPHEEANYEVVQVCSDFVATGAVVGVHCERTRSPELIAKCPFLRRK